MIDRRENKRPSWDGGHQRAQAAAPNANHRASAAKAMAELGWKTFAVHMYDVHRLDFYRARLCIPEATAGGTASHLKVRSCIACTCTAYATRSCKKANVFDPGVAPIFLAPFAGTSYSTRNSWVSPNCNAINQSSQFGMWVLFCNFSREHVKDLGSLGTLTSRRAREYKKWIATAPISSSPPFFTNSYTTPYARAERPLRLPALSDLIAP